MIRRLSRALQTATVRPYRASRKPNSNEKMNAPTLSYVITITMSRVFSKHGFPKLPSATRCALSSKGKFSRICADTLSPAILSAITRRNFKNLIPVTFSERGEIIAGLARIPREHGLYVHWAKLNGEWCPVYFGKSEASVDSGGLHTRIKHHFLRSQKAGGPRKVCDKLRELDVDIEWAISYVLTSKAEKYENRVLSLMDFIGNSKDNGGRRLDDLEHLAFVCIGA